MGCCVIWAAITCTCLHYTGRLVAQRRNHGWCALLSWSGGTLPTPAWPTTSYAETTIASIRQPKAKQTQRRWTHVFARRAALAVYAAAWRPPMPCSALCRAMVLASYKLLLMPLPRRYKKRESSWYNSQLAKASCSSSWEEPASVYMGCEAQFLYSAFICFFVVQQMLLDSASKDLYITSLSFLLQYTFKSGYTLFHIISWVL